MCCHKRAYRSSWSQWGNHKSFTLTIPWNLEILWRMYPGIIVRQHRTDRKLMGLLREQCAELRKEHLRYCCNQFWMKKWWSASMECCCYLRNIQDLLSDGGTPYERRFGVPFNGIATASISGDFLYRHHVVPRVKLYMPREESFPIPLKYIDVTRTTHTTLDVLLGKHIDVNGTLMKIENCQMHGQVSQDALY